MKHFFRTIQVTAIAAGLFLGIIYSFNQKKSKNIEPIKIDNQDLLVIPDFSLIEQNGQSLKFSDIKEDLKLVYFGFTLCPEVCPRILGKLVEAEQTLAKYQIPIKIVFITIDPENDNADILKNYLINLSPNIIGFSGSDDLIKHTADLFGAFYSDKDANTHTTFTYLVYKNKYVGVFHENDTVKHIIDKIVQFHSGHK